MSERSHRHNPAAHSRSRPTHAKRGGPSLTHRPHPTANFIRLRASAAVGPESREADGCPSFLEKENLHADFPLKDIACVLLAQTKDAKIVCVIVDPHTILNALLVLAMIERKLYSYQNARFKQNSQWRLRRGWCILPAVLILWSRR